MISESDERITPQHRSRAAVVYARQSSPQQVTFHKESTRIQLGLRDNAIALGWSSPLVIDDDLGISASGFAERPGFQKMLTQVTKREVGMILCVDACRLSRNSKDWAQLFELCGFFDTLVADLEQVYDLSRPNDRLVLGIKATISEMELGILRDRLLGGLKAKAARGELRINIPVGYVYDPSARMVFDPDRRVQKAIALMFDRFDRSTSVRQLAMWYRATRTLFPVRRIGEHRGTKWECPGAKLLHSLLTHPIYAGVYAWGRRPVRVEFVDGRLRKRVAPASPLERWQEWEVCIRDHHPAYVSWERIVRNEARIRENRPRWTMQENRGAIREGLALLSGLCRCVHCGGRIYVQYKKTSALYYCDGEHTRGSGTCLRFGSHLIDQAVSREVCRALQPLSIEAAIQAAAQQEKEKSQEIENLSLCVQAVQYEADRALEQYDLVDPKNRLVADTLEKRLNERLAELDEAKRQLESAAKASSTFTEEQRERLQDLAGNFEQVWDHSSADPVLKKRILRGAIREVLVHHQAEEQRLEVTIHWQGGVHTRIHVKKRATPVGRKADPVLVDTVRELAQALSDGEIARVLNMKKVQTPTGLSWSKDRLREFRFHHHIRIGTRSPQGETFSLKGAADYLEISRRALLRLERMGAIGLNQVTDFAPCRITREELDSEHVQSLVRSLKETGRFPKGGCAKGQLSLFDDD